MRESEARRAQILINKLKVVYTDVDGTMVGPGGCLFRSSDGTLTLEPARTLFDALKNGIDVVMISGRNRQQMREDARLLGLNNFISELGAEIVYGQGDKVVSVAADFPSGGTSVYETISLWGVPEALFARYKGRLEYHAPWALEPRSYTHLLRGMIDPDEATAWLHSNGFPDLKIIDSGKVGRRGGLKLDDVHAYHIAPNSVDKGEAVAVDRKERDISKDECVGIGDARSDLSLAAHVGAFFLVKNGVDDDPSLLKAALAYDNVFVTDETRGLGWTEAMRLFL